MKFIPVSLVVGLLLIACSNSIDSSDSEFSVITASQDQEEKGVNVLNSPIVSDPANDPYSVENMSKAMRSRVLAKFAADTAEVEQMSLEPNYLYVRFLAEGKKGAAELKAYDRSLVLFKHPLDYKHIRKPVVYIDPALPDTVIPFFATVPVDYKFGPTKYEIIKELFLVEPLDNDCEEDECADVADSSSAEKALLKRAAKKSSASVLERLEAMGVSLHEVQWESMVMTGNVGDRIKAQKREVGELPSAAWSLLGGGKKYGGKLKFWDETLEKECPLEGVRVTGGYSYYWREAHTDKNGEFKIPEKWTFSIDYEANFDSDQFLLENGHSGYGEDLEIEKNDMNGDWKETFSGKKGQWCVVWTAAYQYWYGNNFGLKRPRQNDASNWSLDIEVYFENREDYNALITSDGDIGCNAVKGSAGQYATYGVFENICVITYGKPSHTIYGNTIHEIAHSSHFWNMKTTNMIEPQWSEFNSLDPVYKDSYAVGIQNYFIMKRYNHDNEDYRRHLSGDVMYRYTDLVEDLYDDDGESNCEKVADKKSRDKVSGFSIKNIEKAFFQNKGFSTMKNYLMDNNPSGENGVIYSKKDMDNLFKCWGINKN
ncbi:MAG: hypothetical protein IK012_13095 [Fibrobacter sp.]|uniref:hypothetical protein n=1 Tax=Fibrobacter sp. TaxID=35828 RepID=UPI0025C307C5|nr:hypothetical protein [Fibrobacter sp.]MBR4786168.1 hypothetical protein [Fibrobacter sp.]